MSAMQCSEREQTEAGEDPKAQRPRLHGVVAIDGNLGEILVQSDVT